MSGKTETVTDRLASQESGLETWLWLPLLRLLASGDPVDVIDLAAAAGRPVGDVRRALVAVPDTEYDGSGRIIGQGLTQRSTPHRFEVDGEQLYTWCALDTLIFPAVLGTSARIESSYRGIGTPVRISVDADGVNSVQPATAVLSLVNPADISSVRSTFCNQVHFFASPEEARPWLDAHPEGEILPVAEAYRLGTTIAHRMLRDEGPRPSGTAGISCSC